MNLQIRWVRRLISFALIFLSLAFYAPRSIRAQNAPEPQRQQLLNGLRVVLWPKPGEANVILKLRIHGGAAFDPSTKAGTMALLGDILFPDPTTREYFTEELGGRLEVKTDYDAVNITLIGHAESFERIVEQLRTAIVTTQLTPEVIGKARDERIKVLRQSGISPVLMADRAIATRLFGSFPYGRPDTGTAESVERVDRADLLFARERFLNPNNATLVIVGGVDERRAMRALRQILGGWRKSDKLVPSTFRQADAPDARTLIVDLPGAETTEVRLAARGLARNDRDYAAATLLALLARDRWQTAQPELGKSAYFVRHDARTLPGIFELGASVRTGSTAATLAAARKVMQDLAGAQPSAAELERAKNEALAVFRKQIEQPETLADVWLDADTYNLSSIDDQLRALGNVTPADVQRVAAKLFRSAPVAAVVVGSAAQLSAALERTEKIEVLGQNAQPAQPAATPKKTP